MSKRKPTEYEMAATMAQYAEFKDIYMEGCSAQFLEPRAEMEMGEDAAIDVETSVSTEVEYDEDDHVIFVTSSCEALFMKDADKLLKRKKVLSIQVTFTLEYEYRVNGGPTGKAFDKHLTAFANLNGVFNAWPYFREYVQTTTTRMGITPYYLPMYKIEDDK